MESSAAVTEAAHAVWRYMLIGHDISKADIILALGSNDLRVADRAVELWKAGVAERIVFSGGVGALTVGLYGGLSEAAAFAEHAVKQGVPREAVLVEPDSTNTGENIVFTRKLLQSHGLLEGIKRIVLVQKPFMERRSYATFKKQWPDADVELLVTSPQIPFQSYSDPSKGAGMTEQGILEVMCGDLQRIAVYPAKGFQIAQLIPRSVWSALKLLVSAGYGGHCIKDGVTGGIVALGDADPVPEAVVEDDMFCGGGGAGEEK